MKVKFILILSLLLLAIESISQTTYDIVSSRSYNIPERHNVGKVESVNDSLFWVATKNGDNQLNKFDKYLLCNTNSLKPCQIRILDFPVEFADKTPEGFIARIGDTLMTVNTLNDTQKFKRIDRLGPHTIVKSGVEKFFLVDSLRLRKYDLSSLDLEEEITRGIKAPWELVDFEPGSDTYRLLELNRENFNLRVRSFDFQNKELTSNSLNLNYILPLWGQPIKNSLLYIEKADKWVYEISNYLYSWFYNYFDITDLENPTKMHDGFVNSSIQIAKNDEIFLKENWKWKNEPGTKYIRPDISAIIKCGGEYFGLTDKFYHLKPGAIYLDILTEKRKYEYNDQYVILEYRTNSTAQPDFNVSGPGHISGDTLFFDSAGKINVEVDFEDLTESPKEISFQVDKSTPFFNLLSCGKRKAYYYPLDFPKTIDLQYENPENVQIQINLLDAEGSVFQNQISVTNVEGSNFQITIESIENDRFLPIQKRYCNYAQAFAEEDLGVRIYPNPNNGNFFYLNSRGKELETPQLEIYNLLGRKIDFQIKWLKPFTNQIRIDRGENSKIVFVKNLKTGAVDKVLVE